ncbi:F-type H+-transporting ATPase subunit delta [Gillisia sp. Hel_I_86]|uniref:ATP synthase F1 subunit delta n=1 Tax=Gillisia sp. Hel_I_86 TaxID=1249981 RepID=UPI00119BA2A2|nr:ATP synthase F1 subunit delta [Gillisia sp. Hel_I_86]TVZ26274.1 F-type H+-transporting ATPase subunit delta [Gillisia sp. Hel_I_86]
MKSTRAAQRYAKAILDLAKDQNAAEVVNTDMIGIFNTIEHSEDLQELLASPVVKAAVKKSALKEIFKDAHTITLGAFDVLVDNNRIIQLQAVAQKYTALFNEMNHVQVAKVTTAVPLDARLEAKILEKVKELTGNTATLESIVDPSILGGFILRIGDLQYNTSVAKSLSNLSRELTNNTYISKI